MKKTALFCAFALKSLCLVAQDHHFTQFYAAPLQLNPALTGAFDGKYRVGGVYRDQWRTLLDQPYQTYAFGADMRFAVNRTASAKDKIGAGFSFMHDKVNQIGFSTTQFAFSGAYHKSLNALNTQYLSAGIQFAFMQRNVNYDYLTFQDGFDGVSKFDKLSYEKLPENNFSFGDLSMGVNYSSAPKGKVGLFVGLAMHHFAQPNISFYERPDIVPNKLFTRYSAQLNVPIPINRRVTFTPRVLTSLQGPHLEMNLGANIRSVMNTSGTAIHIGGWARPVRNQNNMTLDAIALLFGMEFNNILFGLSYDLNLPTLTNYKKIQNAFEISLIYLGDYENDELLCPQF
jgi:type IX secretion system PorP/SprF family membrane protein